MSSEIIEKWLTSKKYCLIGQKRIKPVEHNCLKGKPLSSQKGQAEAFFLIDDKGNWLVLKKFHSGLTPDYNYLINVGLLLPKDPGFICGTESQILSKENIVRTKDCYYSKDLDLWLDKTIIMPKISGYDWTVVSDDIRDGNINLNISQRITLCRNLTKLVKLLEADQCCHRDLSCGNVFINTQSCDVSLIDFGSFYHPSITMPGVTTCGTEGYTAGYMWNKNGKLDASKTWCPNADRFALSLLNVEFLTVSNGTGATGEGGIFDQDELRKHSGPGLKKIIDNLKSRYPSAAQLLEKTINSQSCQECPSPDEWNGFIKTIDVQTKQVCLSEIPNEPASSILKILSRRRPAAPLWPAPALDEMPVGTIQIPTKIKIIPTIVGLPADPWSNRKP